LIYALFWRNNVCKKLSFPGASFGDLLLNKKQKKRVVLLNVEITKAWHLVLLFKKTVLSKLLKVTIYVRVALKSAFKGFAPKCPAWKTEFFCIRYFSKMKRKSTKTVTQ